MRRAAVVPGIARLKAGRPGAVTALVGAWGRGSVGAVLLTLSLALVVEGAPGDLDPTFGVGGKVLTDFGAPGEVSSDLASDLVLQPDGKLVAAGRADNDFALARYLPNGNLDPDFGVGGKVTTDFGDDDGASALILQPDGKLVVAGSSVTFDPGGIPTSSDFALARYLPNGNLDPDFGVGGKVTTDFGGLEGASALVLQPDGKLVAAGGTDGDFALARYLPDGSLDPSFGVGGTVTTDLGGDFGALALVLQSDGKLVAAGGGAGLNLALARYLPDGNLDSTFGVGGTVTTDFGDDGGDLAFALVLQPDGKLVAAGGLGDFKLARYRTDGSLDPAFGVGGKVTTDFSGVGGSDTASALALQPDGKLVAAGNSHRPGALIDFALARYLADGSLDPAFGVGGKVTTDFAGAGSVDQASALVLQPDGKLVAAGSAEPGGPADFALARYLSPQLVNDFVTFEPIPSTFRFTPNPAGCPGRFVGKFSFEARLTNISGRALTDLVVEVTSLTNRNLLQNADGGPGGVGAQLTVPRQDDFTDGVLSPDEFVDVPFIICLTQRRPFRFEVDVFGEEG